MNECTLDSWLQSFLNAITLLTIDKNKASVPKKNQCMMPST